MVDNATLRSLPIGEIFDGAKMRKVALAAGLTPAQIDEVITRELADHGGPCYTWFKGKLTGGALAVVMPIMAVALPWPPATAWPPILFLLTLAAAGLWFSRYSAKQQNLSALPAAVLRAHAMSMTRDQISILKDSPIVSQDSDAKALLGDIQSTQSN